MTLRHWTARAAALAIALGMFAGLAGCSHPDESQSGSTGGMSSGAGGVAGRGAGGAAGQPRLGGTASPSGKPQAPTAD
jgi:hypothetical protein